MLLCIDPKVDYVFKKLFGGQENAWLLVHLLNAVIRSGKVSPLPKPVTSIELVPAQTEKESPEEKLTIGDIKARDQGLRQFQVEMQWQVPQFFPKRGLFYWSKFHPQQLREGESYLTLRPTVAIYFANQTRYPKAGNYHLVFHVEEMTHGVRFSDDLEIHLLELPKFDKSAEQVTTDLDRWLYFLKHGADLDPDNLPASLNTPEIRRAMEVLTVFTRDEIEREHYEQRQKALLDRLTEQEYAKNAESIGYERGVEEGEEKGIEKGAVLGRIQLCQEMLKQPLTPSEELASLSLEELTRRLEDLKRQLPAGNGAAGSAATSP